MKPILKWAGGKTQLLEAIRALLPHSYNRYFEPFIGGGALLFALEPKEPIINDINQELINLYSQVKYASQPFMRALSLLDQRHEKSTDAKSNFYDVREEFNDNLGDNSSNQAARLVFLNKHCFNGLYRVNSKGRFNVPFNNKKSGDSYNQSNIIQVSLFLQRATILEGDFQEAVSKATAGDFVFFDSPYAPINPTSFTDYTKEGFALDDHERLARVFRSLTKKGVFCMLTNHNTALVNELYSGFNKKVVSVSRLINSKADARTGEEIIITNYDI